MTDTEQRLTKEVEQLHREEDAAYGNGGAWAFAHHARRLRDLLGWLLAV